MLMDVLIITYYKGIDEGIVQFGVVLLGYLCALLEEFGGVDK